MFACSETGKFVLSLVYNRAVEHVLVSSTANGDALINDVLMNGTKLLDAIDSCYQPSQSVCDARDHVKSVLTQ